MLGAGWVMDRWMSEVGGGRDLWMLEAGWVMDKWMSEVGGGRE